MIKQTISQRNFEIEQIYQTTEPPPTSTPQKKHISWKDEKVEKLEKVEKVEKEKVEGIGIGGENILSKLKKIELPNSNDIIVKELQEINKKLDELLSLTRSK